jgi:Trm5-related predicted tRNA methylase
LSVCGLFAAIPEIFEDHPALKELQEAAVETARKIMSVHSNRHERYRLYREAIEQTPNFGRSLLDVFVKAPPKWKEDEGSPSKKARYM